MLHFCLVGYFCPMRGSSQLRLLVVSPKRIGGEIGVMLEISFGPRNDMWLATIKGVSQRVYTSTNRVSLRWVCHCKSQSGNRATSLY
jgi:hypothetical protein